MSFLATLIEVTWCNGKMSKTETIEIVLHQNGTLLEEFPSIFDKNRVFCFMNFGVDPESTGCDGVHAKLSQDMLGLEILSRFSQLIHGGDQPVSGLVYEHHHGLHLACVIIRGDNVV